MIKYYFKRYKLILLLLMPIYIGVFLLSVIPSKKSITLPGGIKRIESEIIIPSHVSNDFYSVYVMSYDRPTYLQTYMASLTLKP